MDTMTEFKIVMRCAVERFIAVREVGESRKSVFERDETYRNMMKKIKVMREDLGISLEKSDEMFRDAGQDLINSINY